MKDNEVKSIAGQYISLTGLEYPEEPDWRAGRPDRVNRERSLLRTLY